MRTMIEEPANQGGQLVSDSSGSRRPWVVATAVLAVVATGLCLERIGAMTKKQALENMERALALPVDWTLPEAEIFKALREDRRIMDGINAIATHN